MIAASGGRHRRLAENSGRRCSPLHDDTAQAREEAATALTEVSDAWLVGRARELNAVGQHSDEPGQRTTIREADTLLIEAQRRGNPRVVAQLIRHCAALRLTTAGFVTGADPLLDELLSHARRHELMVLEADARALRGRRALLGGSEDNALSEVALALAILDGELVPDNTLGRRSWERLLATAWIDIGWVLTQLGVHEMSDAVMARAQQQIRESGGPHEITVHMINRCRMLLGWGLRLERIGQEDLALERFATASALAAAVEAPWRDSLFPRLPDRSAADQMSILGAAHALAGPSPDHLDRLWTLQKLDQTGRPRERIIFAIALSRCLNRAERREEAVRVLSGTQADLDCSEPSLRISLAREHARLSEPADGATSEAVHRYVYELEEELAAMREARVQTLDYRLEHAKLAREHNTVTRQALQDPLTGLPNRRALDDRLDSLMEQPDSQPLSVALVDLDGFKEVNDHRSHAEGDDVLRLVATSLQEALRGDDLVARYGGDEFVVLLPGAPLAAAEAALQRAVERVAGLPESVSRGVTLSIGVVSMLPQESSSQVLARADAAMYQAKGQGGNRVSSFPSRASDTSEARAAGRPASDSHRPPPDRNESGEDDQVSDEGQISDKDRLAVGKRSRNASESVPGGYHQSR